LVVVEPCFTVGVIRTTGISGVGWSSGGEIGVVGRSFVGTAVVIACIMAGGVVPEEAFAGEE